MLVGQYHFKYSVNNTVDFHIDNAIINNSCIVINDYICPLIFTTNSTKTTQYSREIYVAIVVPSLQNEQETTNWIVNSPEGSTVLTKSITSNGINNEALLKDSIARVDMTALQQYSLTVVFLGIGGKDKQYSTMSQDENPEKAYPPPATFNLQTFFGIYNVDTQETLYAFWQKNSGEYITWDNDNSTTGGGDGEYDDNSSDTIGLPDLTNLNSNSINNTRFFTCYKLTPEQLTKLSNELWSKNFIDIISNSVLKPTDFIVSMNMIPIDVPSTPKMMKAGQWLLNGAIGGVISGQFFRVDCGSIQIKKKWGGALDYLTKIALYLPFIGEVQLSPDDVMGSTISVIYTVDVMTGSCLASVKIVRDNLDAILYQYNGNCSATYPIVSQDYSALMSGVLQLGIHSVADYTKSLPQLNKKGTNKGAIKNAKITRRENLVSGATSCLFDISPNVQRVGNMSSTVGFMGIKKPFIILSRPIQSLAENYNTYRGFVSNITMTLGDCTGYTEVEEVHLENISATENEISEIEDLLQNGVIF